MAQKVQKEINQFNKFSYDLILKMKLVNPYIRLTQLKEIDEALKKHNLDLFKIITIDEKHDDLTIDDGNLDRYDEAAGNGDPYYNWGQYD